MNIDTRLREAESHHETGRRATAKPRRIEWMCYFVAVALFCGSVIIGAPHHWKADVGHVALAHK